MKKRLRQAVRKTRRNGQAAKIHHRTGRPPSGPHTRTTTGYPPEEEFCTRRQRRVTGTQCIHCFADSAALKQEFRLRFFCVERHIVATEQMDAVDWSEDEEEPLPEDLLDEWLRLRNQAYYHASMRTVEREDWPWSEMEGRP